MIHIPDFGDIVFKTEIIKKLIKIVAVCNDRMGRISFFELNICDEPFLHIPSKKKEEILLMFKQWINIQKYLSSTKFLLKK